MNCNTNNLWRARARLFVAAVLVSGAALALAQSGDYPARPVRVVVAFPPGGGVDVIARIVAQRLPAVWSQQVVVDNRPGAAGVIATRLVASAPTDGYTVLMHSTSMVIAQLANSNAGYNIERDLIPVLNAGNQASIIVAAVAPMIIASVGVLSILGVWGASAMNSFMEDRM